MVETVDNGTGQAANVEGVGAGGKTGSAQSGWLVDGETMTQGWFVGFFPKDNPKYTIAVMAENGKSGGTSCAPVFKRIAERIIEIE
jgi:cell division protein FtsI/penicillin-binding protein 2